MHAVVLVADDLVALEGAEVVEVLDGEGVHAVEQVLVDLVVADGGVGADGLDAGVVGLDLVHLDLAKGVTLGMLPTETWMPVPVLPSMLFCWMLGLQRQPEVLMPTVPLNLILLMVICLRALRSRC